MHCFSSNSVQGVYPKNGTLVIHFFQLSQLFRTITYKILYFGLSTMTHPGYPLFNTVGILVRKCASNSPCQFSLPLLHVRKSLTHHMLFQLQGRKWVTQGLITWGSKVIPFCLSCLETCSLSYAPPVSSLHPPLTTSCKRLTIYCS